MDNVEQPGNAQDSNVSESAQDSSERTFELDGKAYTESQLKQFVSGGLRQDDYTRKTQELANQRKEVEMLARLAKEDPTQFLKISGGEAKAKPEFDDPLEAELFDVKNSTQSLEKKFGDLLLGMEMEKARAAYPQMDESWVKAQIALGSDASVTDLAKESVDRMEAQVKAYLNAKKQDVTKTNAGGGAGVTTGQKEPYKVPRTKTGKIDFTKLRSDAAKKMN